MNSRISRLAFLLQLIASSQCKTIIILTSMNDNCPGGAQCTTLQEYASYPSQFSAVVLELQPGNHTLSTRLSVANIDNFTIIGNDSRVVCTSGSGDSELSLTSVQNVFITEVSIIGCDQNVLSRNGDSIVIRNVEFRQNRENIVELVNTVVVIDSVFDTNTDTALILTSIMNFATIEGCIFCNNGHRGVSAVSSDLEISRSTFYNNRGPAGGCIHVQSSTVTIRVTNFTECTSEGGFNGGAIYGQQVAFVIAKTNFTDNRAGFGGGAIAGGSSSFNITSSNFIRNSGTQWGGAIKADVGTCLLTLADTNFFSNAALKGGGVYTVRLDSLVGCSFMNNEANSDGGGLWVQTVQSITISNCDFVNNTNDERGGGMYIKTGSVVDNISVSIVRSRFSDNIAGRGHGGGVYFSSDGQYASMMVIESSFRNNTATSSQENLRSKNTIQGGAIFISGGSSSVYIDSSNFLINSASGSGGGVYVGGSIVVNSSNFTENSALLGEGGAIYSNGHSANIALINSMFDYNSAPSCGVLGINERFHIVEFRDCSLTHNAATGVETGGGVSCISSASVSIVNSNMSHNSANMNAGVLYINDGIVQIENSNFANNSAERYGGVAYTYIHAVSYSIFESTFYQNSAGSSGGVLYIGRRSSSVAIKESEFSNTSATERGGVISIIGSDLIINTTNFNHNTANRGKIISACNSIVSIYNSTGQVLTQISRDICTYFDSVNNYSLTEPLNRTSGFGQALCTNCDAFIILTSSDNCCPGEFTGNPCLTLQQYAGSPSFAANISLLLEPGNHTLTRELIASSSYNYSMAGSDSKILCDTSAQISITSIQHVSIIGVSFMGCAQNVISASGESVELRNVIFSRNRINEVESVNNLMVIDSTFDGNSDTGLDLRSIANRVKIENCIFSNNGHRGITVVSSDLEISRSTFYNNRGPGGGCIHAQSSTVTIRVSNFTECTSEGGIDGGAIYGQQVAFTIADTNFTDNNGYGGGAIAGTFSLFNITSSNFIRNIGMQWGGAIKADTGTRLLTLADTNFISNTARSGGAVFAYRLDTLVCCNFINNAGVPGNGGGLYLQTLIPITISYCNFLNNTNNNGGFGGAGASIFVESVIDYVSVNIIGSSFVNNTALPGHGGGLYFKSNGQHASITITESSFRNNSANLHESAPHRSIINGGAIYFTGSNGSIFINNSDLMMNSASISGGAIYVTGSVSVSNSTFSQNRALMGEGGAIISNQQNAFVSLTQTIFSENTAPSCGAISIQNFNHVVTLTNSSFVYNGGTNHINGRGGVACFLSSAISTITSNFQHNMANNHGGVFLIHLSSFRFEDSHFYNNFALKDGGVIYSSTSFQNLSTISRSSFIQNTAGRDGGVLFIESSGEQLNISQSTFSDNSANSSGGVIHVSESAVQIIETNFLNNTAGLGDAICACDSDITILDSQLTVSTDSSNCSLYDGNVDSFRIFSPTLIDCYIAFNTNLTIFAATCPFEYNTEDVNAITTPMTATSTPEVTTTTRVRPDTTATKATTTTSLTEQTSGTLSQGTTTGATELLEVTTTTEARPDTTATEVTTTISLTEQTSATELLEVTTTTGARSDTTATEATATTSLTEQTNGTLTTTGATELLDTTAAPNTEAGSSMGASELSEAAIGGMVACLTVLLLVIVSSIGGYILYHSLHKKSQYNLKVNNPYVGMSFKNKKFLEDQKMSDTIETRVNLSTSSEETTERTMAPEGTTEQTIFPEGTTEQTIVSKGPKLDVIKPEHMKCPVCKDIQIDPCTLQCGHTVCQLCLARMWKRQKQFCPLCKEHWQVYPAITIDYRDNIEKLYGEEVAQLRNLYTREDKELIKEFQLIKKPSSPASIIHDQEFSSQDCEGKELKQVASNTDYKDQSTSAYATQPQLSQPLDTNTANSWYPQSDEEESKQGCESLDVSNADYEDLPISAYAAQPLLSQPLDDNTDDSWYPQSDSEESKHCQEHIYASTLPRLKIVGSKPSVDLPHIRIKNHPKSDINIKYHGTVTLSVYATGAKPLCYEWKKNGQNITNPTCSGVYTCTLSIDHFSPEHEGEYTCIVSDDEENFESISAELKLGLHITKHPQFPPRVKYGDYVAIFVSAVGDQKSLRYSWKFNGGDINLASSTGSNTRILVIKSCSIEHQGTYTCIVSNSRGEIESNPAHLTLAMEFDSSMPTNDFHVWLQLKGLSEDDLRALKCEKISTASIFQKLDSNNIKKLKLSVGGRILVRTLLDEIRAGCNIQASATATLKKEHGVSQKGLKVNIGDLQLLKWCNKSGEDMQTMIIDRVCHKWKTIATLISKKNNTIAVLSQRHHNDPSQCVRQVFQDCFISNKPAFGRYSQDWDGIIELLKDIEEEALSEEVREWLQMH